MKNLFWTALLLVNGLMVYSQSGSAVFGKEDYMKGCLETAKSLPGVTPKDYCECTYSQLMSTLTMEELQEFVDFLGTGAEQDDAVAFIMGKPKIMSVIMGCMDGSVKAVETAQASNITMESLSKKDMAEIKKTFTTECLKGVNAQPMGKDFNAKKYCACAWEKIMNTDNPMQYFLDFESDASKELIQQVAEKCVAEQSGK